MREEEITQKAERKILVLLNEEHGYRQWFWFPGMSADELEGWWTDIESIMPYWEHPAKTLPGTLVPVDSQEEYVKMYCLEQSGEYFSAHIHLDCDSRLVAPGDRPIYHEGYLRLAFGDASGSQA